MAIITMQGFDTHDWSTTYFQGWSQTGTVTHSSSGGRRDTGCITMTTSNAEARYTLPANESFLVAGFAAYFGEATFTEENFFVMRDDSASTNQIVLTLNTDGSLSIYRNTTLLETSQAGVIVPQRWCFIEVMVTIHNTAGRYTVRVNESTVLSRVNQDTQQSANAWVDQIRFAHMGGINDAIDDFYLLDAAGTVNTTLLGDMIVDTKTVAANGSLNEWVPLSGDNYEMVDEDLLDEDTTYVSSSVVSDKDLYTINSLTDLGATGTVNCVMVCSAVRHDGGSQGVRCIVRIDGNDYSGSTYNTLGDYEYCEAMWEHNPDTLAVWDEDAVNDLEIGIWLVS